jgi:phosphatidylglycerophosphate synthase
MDKVPAQYAFIDFSDYARPFAKALVQVLLPTPVTPIHITWAFTAVGFFASVLFAMNLYLPLAGMLLLLKSGLDAADGSLARARNKPSRVGRFLDSVCDFAVTVMIFTGIAIGTGQWLLCAMAGFSLTLQCSVFSYYYVRYRAQTGGDQTSKVDESQSAAEDGDDPTTLRVVHGLYLLIYRWQDIVIDRIDQAIAPGKPVSPRFLTATTVMGLGAQLLFIAICAAFSQPLWAAWGFVIVFNLYWGILLGGRRVAGNARPPRS